MKTGEIITQILLLFGGIGVFMLGLTIMSDNLQKSAGNKLKKGFERLTSKKINGLLVGAGTTAVIQSSSATTVIVVGFVNAGLIGLNQAAPLIMGANIGTTATAFLMALPFSEFLAATGCAGAFVMMLSKNENAKKVAMIFVGLGTIFIGLIVMSTAVRPFAPALKSFFELTSNPILLLLIGLVFTALIQSSSAATGILIALASAGNGAITIESAMFVILGVNIGTCITAFIASIGTSANARRAALIHILFNVIGAVFFGILLIVPPVMRFISFVLLKLPDIKLQIAFFHIFFNIITSLLLLPLSGGLVKFTQIIIKNDKEKPQGFKPKYLNEMMLSAPSIAVNQVKNEILGMYSMACENFNSAMEALSKADLNDMNAFQKREEDIDALNRIIPEYIVKLTSEGVSYKDKNVLSTFYYVVGDIERIGDYAEGIVKYTERMILHNIEFSGKASDEIKDMYGRISELAKIALEAFAHEDITKLAQAYSIENSVDMCKKMFYDAHIERLGEGKCTAENGAVFISIITHMKSIAGHFTNVAKSISNYAS